MKPVLLNVTSVNQNQYGTGNQISLRKTYGFVDSSTKLEDVLKIVENLRFKGLVGITARGEFSDPDAMEMSACTKAMEDAGLKADVAFEKLNLQKGEILQVYVNYNDYNMRSDNYYGYAGSSYNSQYNFSMVPTRLNCSVNVRYEIARK